LGSTLGTDRISLSWNYTGEDVTHFKIGIFDSGDSPIREETISGTFRSVVVTNLEPATSYKFQLRSCTQDECTKPSEPIILLTGQFPVNRSLADRPDDITGPQVHIVYAVPFDKADRYLDTVGILKFSVRLIHNWFRHKSNLQIRFDRYNGELDITFFRLELTSEELRPDSPNLVLNIESELRDAGLLSEDKIYLVYYDGESELACGGASWPPVVPGQTAALYLRGKCENMQFVLEFMDFPGYWEFAAIHDLIHVLGVVSEDAPGHNNEYPAHVDAPTDLMHTGEEPWQIGPEIDLDVLGNNYFGPGVAEGVPNLADSPFLENIPEGVALYPMRYTSGLEIEKLNRTINNLPFHLPFVSEGEKHERKSDLYK
jgi:hypothetical protein